jgi:hypothetical protein
MRCCLRSRWPGGWMWPRPSARWSGRWWPAGVRGPPGGGAGGGAVYDRLRLGPPVPGPRRGAGGGVRGGGGGAGRAGGHAPGRGGPVRANCDRRRVRRGASLPGWGRRCLHVLAAATFMVDSGASRPLFKSSLELARASGDRWAEADSLQFLGFSHLMQHRPAPAGELRGSPGTRRRGTGRGPARRAPRG